VPGAQAGTRRRSHSAMIGGQHGTSSLSVHFKIRTQSCFRISNVRNRGDSHA
jgi:hypothetical protein